MMALSYSFAIVRLAPKDARDERLNVGIAVFSPEGLDLKVSRRLDKVRALSLALNPEDLRNLLEALVGFDEHSRANGISDPEERRAALSNIAPLGLSPLGSFTARHASDYEQRVETIMKAMVDPEPAFQKVRAKRTHLLSQVKSVFRSERVLAKRGEDVTSHRIVSGVPLHEGLIADLVLKNGAMHVVETVDVSQEGGTPHKILSEIAISGLVLESARMKFGEKKTTTRLVYEASSSAEKIAKYSLDAVENQGAELINWASAHEKRKFIQTLSSLAEPIPRARRHAR